MKVFIAKVFSFNFYSFLCFETSAFRLSRRLEVLVVEILVKTLVVPRFLSQNQKSSRNPKRRMLSNLSGSFKAQKFRESLKKSEK